MPTAPSPTTTHLQTRIVSHHPLKIAVPIPQSSSPCHCIQCRAHSASCRSGEEIRTLLLRRPWFRCRSTRGLFSNLRHDCTSAALLWTLICLSSLGLRTGEGSARGDRSAGCTGPGLDLRSECSRVRFRWVVVLRHERSMRRQTNSRR